MRIGYLWAAAIVTVGCSRGADDYGAGPTGTVAPKGSGQGPIDHLAPDELVEGRESALGLKLPRDLKTTVTTNERVIAEGHIDAERVANYVRARVKDGKMTVGASSTTFESVHLLADPKRLLGVKIAATRGTAYLEVWDMTPKPKEPDPGNDVERWRKAGFKPDGTPLDPQMH
jgi:hypothetical protein